MGRRDELRILIIAVIVVVICIIASDNMGNWIMGFVFSPVNIESSSTTNLDNQPYLQSGALAAAIQPQDAPFSAEPEMKSEKSTRSDLEQDMLRFLKACNANRLKEASAVWPDFKEAFECVQDNELKVHKFITMNESDVPTTVYAELARNGAGSSMPYSGCLAVIPGLTGTSFKLTTCTGGDRPQYNADDVAFPRETLSACYHAIKAGDCKRALELLSTTE